MKDDLRKREKVEFSVLVCYSISDGLDEKVMNSFFDSF
jgi:hypothetical protein